MAEDEATELPQQQQENEVDAPPYPKIEYAMDSFYVIVKPVLLTMILSALAVVYINTAESIEEGQASLSGYVAVSTDSTDTTGQQLGASLVNGLIIVSVICVLTFVIVLLYKYRCMKLLMGYMILSSMMLLGYLSAYMFQVAIDRYSLKIDAISFWLFIYNFAVVGTYSIFSAKGIPAFVTQGYLIATSVIVAWQLAHFDDWTGWGLLVMLALYDLFAVLTPCGPLKALVNLMQRDDAPDMPGLLYEATLPSQQQRSRQATNANTSQSSASQQQLQQQRQASTVTEPTNTESSVTSNRDQQQQRTESTLSGTTHTNYESEEEKKDENVEVPLSHLGRSLGTPISVDGSPSDEESENETVHSSQHSSADSNDRSSPQEVVQVHVQRPATQQVIVDAAPVIGEIPFALAKLYKLPFSTNPQPPWIRRARGERVFSEEEVYTPSQLTQIVQVVFPPGGGKLVPHSRQRPTDQEIRYQVLDRTGQQKRILFVNNQGRVFEDLREENDGAREQQEQVRNSIRLGLGDFIFYSVLVSKAAIYSFTTFAACSLVIIVGLGLTLVLLAVRGQALPALPISIFFGVSFYVIVRYGVQPWIHEIFIQQSYV